MIPIPYYRERLCRLFGKNAQELGLAQMQEETNQQGTLHPPIEPVAQTINRMQEEINQQGTPQEVLPATSEPVPLLTAHQTQMGLARFFIASHPCTSGSIFHFHKRTTDLSNTNLAAPPIRSPHQKSNSQDTAIYGQISWL